MKQAVRLFLFLLTVSLLISCASGHKIKYSDTVADIPASGNKKAAVAVHDMRPYIVAGRSDPDYVGLNRAGFKAVPFKPSHVATESGRPLAEDISASICKSLAAKGFAAFAVSAAPGEDKDKLLARMKQTGAERLIILTLHEWQSDTYINTGLFYDVKLEVFDANGKRLAEQDLKGEDSYTRPDAIWSATEYMKTAVPKAFKGKLEILFNNKDVIESLQ